MTVQETIDELNKVEDKSKELKYLDTVDNICFELGEVNELDKIVTIR
jgi:hypothetical protein